MENTAKPKIVPGGEWQQAPDDLLKAEKEGTRALDALAARRRRLPMMKFGDHYVFDTPAGPKTLADLFEGRDQLVTYQFMDLGPDRCCALSRKRSYPRRTHPSPPPRLCPIRQPLSPGCGAARCQPSTAAG